MKKVKKLKDLKQILGRGSWQGLKPTTRVVPNKKKTAPTRKAKHKGRQIEADPFFWPSNQVMPTHGQRPAKRQPPR